MSSLPTKQSSTVVRTQAAHQRALDENGERIFILYAEPKDSKHHIKAGENCVFVDPDLLAASDVRRSEIVKSLLISEFKIVIGASFDPPPGVKAKWSYTISYTHLPEYDNNVPNFSKETYVQSVSAGLALHYWFKSAQRRLQEAAGATIVRTTYPTGASK